MSQKSAERELTLAIRKIIIHYKGNLNKFFEYVQRQKETA